MVRQRDQLGIRAHSKLLRNAAAVSLDGALGSAEPERNLLVQFASVPDCANTAPNLIIGEKRGEVCLEGELLDLRPISKELRLAYDNAQLKLHFLSYRIDVISAKSNNSYLVRRRDTDGVEHLGFRADATG
jgi:hypothetical protein